MEERFSADTGTSRSLNIRVYVFKNAFILNRDFTIVAELHPRAIMTLNDRCPGTLGPGATGEKDRDDCGALLGSL
jgi:hypothetical protein